MTHLLSLLLLTPLAGAVLLLLPLGAPAVRRTAASFAGLELLLSLPLWFRYDPAGPSWQLTERASLVPSIGASYFLGVDGFSVLLVLTTTLIGLVAVLASWSVVAEPGKGYYACLLALQSSLLGAFLALDALLFSVCWALTLATMARLIGGWGGGRRPALRFSLYAATGSGLLLAGILMIYFAAHAASGVYSFDISTLHQLTLPLAIQQRIFSILFAGLAIAVPMLLFHAWPSDGQSGASAAGSIVPGAVLLTMGTYGLVRLILPIVPDASRSFIPLVAGLSIVGILYGAILALIQTDWKRLIAYLSVSQMGMMTLALFTVTPAALSGSLLQQVSRTISAAGLLLLADIARQRHLSLGRRGLTPRSIGMPLFAVGLLVMILSWAGMPGLNGFVGQRMMVEGVFAVHRLWAVAIAGGMVLGTVAMLRLYRLTVFSRSEALANGAGRDLTARELVALGPLVAVALWIGLYPAPLLARLEPTMARVITRIAPGYLPAFEKVPGCGSSSAPAPSAPAGFTAIAPCDAPAAPPAR